MHFRLYQRECEKLILNIEKTLNAYRDVIEKLVNEHENRLSDGKNSEDE